MEDQSVLENQLEIQQLLLKQSNDWRADLAELVQERYCNYSSDSIENTN